MIEVTAQPAMQVMPLDTSSPMSLTYQQHEHVHKYAHECS